MSEGINDTVCCLKTSAFDRNMEPDRRDLLPLPVTAGGALTTAIRSCEKPVTSTLLNLLGEFLHRSSGYGSTFTAFQRLFRLINGCEDIFAGAFVLFP